MSGYDPNFYDLCYDMAGGLHRIDASIKCIHRLLVSAILHAFIYTHAFPYSYVNNDINKF